MEIFSATVSRRRTMLQILFLTIVWVCIGEVRCVRPGVIISPRELISGPDGSIPDLIETPGAHLDPKPKDLNATILAAKLWPNLDPNYMSITKPKSQPHPSFPFRRNRKGRLVPVGTMPEHLQELETSFLRLADGSAPLATKVSPKLRKKLIQVLWALTACPVAHKWRDLGPRFWPRYLREGHCPTGPRRSCSVPPGMKCRPAHSQHKTLLRWYCQQGNNNNNCKWIKVQYPVVTKCACACPHQSSSYS